MVNCIICRSINLSSCSYGNHLNKKFRIRYFKHYAAHILFPIINRYFPNSVVNYPRIGKLFIKSLFSPFYSIIICNKCGYGQYSRKIDIIQIEKYYDSIYWQSCGDIEEKYMNSSLSLKDERAKGQLNFIEPYLKKSKKLEMLEIGAGPAHISVVIRDSFGNVDIDVVEPSNFWITHYTTNNMNVVSRFFPFSSGKMYNTYTPPTLWNMPLTWMMSLRV